MIDFQTLVPKIDKILARGLSNGLGKAGGQVCVEAAICEALGLPHGDDPKCVVADVRAYKIRLNDSKWSSPEARAKGLRDLAIAQLGTKGVLENGAFSKLMAEKTIRVLIPALFRDVLKSDPKCMAAADRCEREGTRDAVCEARGAADAYAAYAAYAAASDAAASDAAAYAAASDAAASDAAAYAADAYAAYAAYADAYAAYAAYAAASDASAAYAAAYADAAAYAAAAYAAKKRKGDPDKYLLLSAKLALEALTELNAPGVAYL